MSQRWFVRVADGGARGGAHIGVLKVLEELHVPIDCIAGTSTPIGTTTLRLGKATGSWAGWLTIGTAVGSGSILNQPMFR
jgi:hypothetical protein